MFNNRYLRLVTGFGFALLLGTASLARGGGAGEGGTPGDFLLCQGGDAAGLECNVDADCPRSTCVATNFLPDLPRVCQSGANQGQACTTDANCPKSTCGIDFTAQPKEVEGTLTFIVDDDETNFSTGGACGAATVLLEVTNGGQTYFLSQTYLCLPTETDLDIDFLRTEAGLSQAVADGSLLNRLLFRGADGGADDPARGELAQQLRDLFETTGRPIIVGTPRRIGTIYTDHEDDTLASAVRLGVVIRFVQQ